MKTKVEQAWASRAKVIRTAIRLKHSIEADAEIEAVLEEERKRYMRNVLKGIMPPALDIAKILDA